MTPLLTAEDRAQIEAITVELKTIIRRRADCLHVEEAAAIAEAVALLASVEMRAQKQIDSVRGHQGDNCGCAIGDRHFWYRVFCDKHNKFIAAEAECARLRDALTVAAENECCYGCDGCAEVGSVARAALAASKETP